MFGLCRPKLFVSWRPKSFRSWGSNCLVHGDPNSLGRGDRNFLGRGNPNWRPNCLDRGDPNCLGRNDPNWQPKFFGSWVAVSQIVDPNFLSQKIWVGRVCTQNFWVVFDYIFLGRSDPKTFTVNVDKSAKTRPVLLNLANSFLKA